MLATIPEETRGENQEGADEGQQRATREPHQTKRNRQEPHKRPEN